MKDKIRMNIAENVSSFSKSRRTKVGAIIVRDNHIVAEGYNGTVQGYEPDILEYFIPINDTVPEHLKDIDIIETVTCPVCNGNKRLQPSLYLEPKKCYACKGQGRLKIFDKTDHANTFHAEANLLLFCAKKGISTEDADLYVTLSPCINCANLIIQAGIKRVFYKNEYRSTSGIEKLKRFIEVIKI